MAKKNKINLVKKSIIIIFCALLFLSVFWIIRELILKKTPTIQNFILLSIDDLRADRLGCYGNKKNTSPCIDTLASQGTQFMHAFISWPFTPPSHTSMLTSLYPSVFDFPLDPNIPTVASILNNHGYKTTAFTEDGYMSAGYGILNGFKEYDDRVIGLKKLEIKTTRWLKKNSKEKFFLFIHTYYVHFPFYAPEEYLKKFSNTSYKGPVKNNPDSTSNFIQLVNSGKIVPTKEDIQRLIDIYDAQIRRIDDFVSLLLKTLKKLNLTDKTMLIITSDHGEQFYEYRRIGHKSRFNPFADISTRVPLIIYCPMLPHKGKVNQLVESIDLPPTILEAAGIDPPKTFQGQSLLPILCKKPRMFLRKKKEVFYWNPPFAGIRTEKLKLTLNLHSGEIKLYDLLKDPMERKNISKDASKAKKIVYF